MSTPPLDDNGANLPAWVADLAHPDYRVRAQAAREIGKARCRDALEALLVAAQDRVMTVRQAAVGALGRLRDPAALPALWQAFTDAHHQVREAAGPGLVAFGAEVVPGLAAHAADRTRHRADRGHAIELLGRIRRPEALQALLALWADLRREARPLPLPTVPSSPSDSSDHSPLTEALYEGQLRATAVRALGRWSAPAATAALVEAAADPDPHVGDEAARLLAPRDRATIIPPLLARLRQGELAVVAPLRQLAVPDLADELAAQLAAGGPGDPLRVAFALAWLGDERARPLLLIMEQGAPPAAGLAPWQGLALLNWVQGHSGVPPAPEFVVRGFLAGK